MRVVGLYAKGQEADGLRIPKLPVEQAHVSQEGVEGDYNRSRHERDRDNPNRALLIMPAETIQDLNNEGWPVRPGDMGENITTEGLLNTEFYVGGQLRIGEVLAELAENTAPCQILGQLPYVGPQRVDEFIETLIGRRGWYARVVEGGKISVGDRVCKQ